MSEVSKFFDRISGSYSSRYTNKRLFLSYYFIDRLEKSIPCDFRDSNFVLDVGAGTGALYDHFINKGYSLPNYFGTDISEGMLNNSNIPPEKRFVGDFRSSCDLDILYDNIFCLGVTTYVDPIDLTDFLSWLKDHTNSSGTISISFTNSSSVGIFNYRVVKSILSLFTLSSNVIGLKSNTSYISSSAALSHFKGYDCHLIYLNHGIYPITKFFPSLSIFFAKFLFSRLPFPIQKFFANDFLIIAKKRY